MIDKDWTEKIDEMDIDRLRIFAIHAIGALGHYQFDKTPDQVFDEIYELGEK